MLRVDCCPRPGKMTFNEDLAAQLRAVLKEEFADVRRRLDDLSSGQAVLTSSVEQMHHKLEPSLALSGNECLKQQVSHAKGSINNEGGKHSRRKATELNEKARAELSRLDTNRLDALNRLETLKQLQEQAGITERVKLLSPNARDLILDQVVSGIVVLNAIFIGVSSDYWDGEINTFFWIDLFFCVVFLTELFIKIRMHGLREHFTGKDKLSHTFDCLLVLLDTLQLLVVVFARNVTYAMQKMGIPSASLFRIMRTIRITRILRVLRQPIFEELLAMFEGIISGAGTLAMAFVLFLLVIYIIALLCRDVLGRYNPSSQVFQYFSSVPRSMFTVFRCSFGECSNVAGMPLPEIVNEEYGALYSIIYSGFLFLVVVGLMNVISAIFVDRTLARAARLTADRTRMRLADQEVWATQVSTVVRRCLVKLGVQFTVLDELSIQQEIPSELLDELCRSDKEVIAALNELGIDSYDHANLADIIDQDHSGAISFHELIIGLRHMRGLPRRSDVVTNGLMLQAVQAKLDDLFGIVSSIRSTHNSLGTLSPGAKSPGFDAATLSNSSALFWATGEMTSSSNVKESKFCL